MRKYKVYLPVVFIVLLLVALIVFRDDLSGYVSKNMTSRLPQDAKEQVGERISKEYDYSSNGQGYEYTFLEFGSTGCNACRQMVTVMEAVRSSFPDKVKVVFVNVAEKGNGGMADFYGVATIPTQVLLDRKGKEFYRHSGYISADDLSRYFK